MKTLNEIYESIKNKFYTKSKLDIQPGTAIDSFTVASADAISEAYKEIEANKKPYLFTKQEGDELDSTGFLVNCPRLPNESDINYFYRISKWTSIGEASNKHAIEAALLNLQNASNATHIPLTQGVGTGTIYIIPKTYDNDGPAKAIAEVQQKLANVISPGAVIDYIVPTIKPVKLVLYISSKNGDMNLIKSNITKKVQNYVNSIAPGSELEIGQINKIGVNEPGVSYFNLTQIYIEDKEVVATNILQKLDSKLLFDEIIWWVVNR